MKDIIIRWTIATLGVFVIPPMISIILGILAFIYSSTEKDKTKCIDLKVYGSCFILAAIFSFITF